MPEALRAHFASRESEHAGVLGVFLCQASRLPELITELIKISALADACDADQTLSIAI